MKDNLEFELHYYEDSTDCYWTMRSNSFEFRIEEDNVFLNRYYGNEENITIPKGVTVIGLETFKNSYSLVSVTIPESVRKIENDAFARCDNLKNINIPNGVTHIGYGAFRGCKSLETITIPESVVWVEGFAFEACSSLKTINIPESVIYISDDVFDGCENLNFYVTGNNLYKNIYEMTIEEGLLLHIFISQIIKENKKNKEQITTYTTTVQELARNMDYNPENLRCDLNDIVMRLAKRCVTIQVKDNNDNIIRDMSFHWIVGANYSQDKLTLNVSERILNYKVLSILETACKSCSYY